MLAMMFFVMQNLSAPIEVIAQIPVPLSNAELVFDVPHVTVPVGTTETVLRIPFTHTGVARSQMFIDLGDFAPGYPLTFVVPVLVGIDGFGLPLVPQGGPVGTQRRGFMWNHGPQGPQGMFGPTFSGHIDIRVVIPAGAPAGSVATVTLDRGDDNLAVGGGQVYVPVSIGSVTIEGDHTVPPPPIHDINVGDPFVRGTGIPGATVVVTLPNNVTRTVVVAPNGNWAVIVAGLNLVAGDPVSATQTDEGVTSLPYDTNVIGETRQIAILYTFYEWTTEQNGGIAGDIVAGDNVTLTLRVDSPMTNTVNAYNSIVSISKLNFLYYDLLGGFPFHIMESELGELTFGGDVGGFWMENGRIYFNLGTIEPSNTSRQIWFTLPAADYVYQSDVPSRNINITRSS